jgi:hypothetical protein
MRAGISPARSSMGMVIPLNAPLDREAEARGLASVAHARPRYGIRAAASASAIEFETSETDVTRTSERTSLARCNRRTADVSEAPAGASQHCRVEIRGQARLVIVTLLLPPLEAAVFTGGAVAAVSDDVRHWHRVVASRVRLGHECSSGRHRRVSWGRIALLTVGACSSTGEQARDAESGSAHRARPLLRKGRPAAVVGLETPRRPDCQAMPQSAPIWRAPPNYRSAGKAVARNGPIGPFNCVGSDEDQQSAAASRWLPLRCEAVAQTTPDGGASIDRGTPPCQESRKSPPNGSAASIGLSLVPPTTRGGVEYRGFTRQPLAKAITRTAPARRLLLVPSDSVKAVGGRSGAGVLGSHQQRAEREARRARARGRGVRVPYHCSRRLEISRWNRRTQPRSARRLRLQL